MNTITITEDQLAQVIRSTPLGHGLGGSPDQEEIPGISAGLAHTLFGMLAELPQETPEPVSPARALLAQLTAHSPSTNYYNGQALAVIAHAVTGLDETMRAIADREAANRAEYESRLTRNAEPEPRPTRMALMAFAADVLACAPDDAADPSSEDTEALEGLAFSAGQLLAGEDTIYDRAEPGDFAGIACAGCGQDCGSRGHLMDKQVRGEFAYLCDRCYTLAAGLLARIKQIEDSDGSWQGGDTVELLCEWFTDTLGFDIESREGTRWTDDDNDQEAGQ